jgi:hypothetical protein
LGDFASPQNLQVSVLALAGMYFGFTLLGYVTMKIVQVRNN